jgi:hypothetical protein
MDAKQVALSIAVPIAAINMLIINTLYKNIYKYGIK